MDLSESIAPRSDQLNADDLIAGPITVTITDVHPGAAEQPVDIVLAETPGRAYRPSKSMRRVLVAAWGRQSQAYMGHRLTLYRNPEITFGKDRVGGIEISHLSHIDKPLTLALTRARGKRTPFTVQPLTELAAYDWTAEIAAATTEDELRHIWDQSDKGQQVSALITARKADLAGGTSA